MSGEETRPSGASSPSALSCGPLRGAAEREPYPQKLGMTVLALEPGLARVQMEATRDLANLFGTVHGGALFSLVDEAFQLACNSHGTTALALNVSITYVRAAVPGDRMTAEAREVARTSRTGSYEVRVTRADGELLATAQALAYRKKEPLPFLEPGKA
jgi:acyl-CoA thioesterase